MKKTTLIITLIFLTISLCLTPRNVSAANNTYYVSTSGNDSNSGTQSTPWRTIQKAATVAKAGDTVYVRSGTYREKVIVQNSGTAGNYITFSAYPGETVTIDVNGINMVTYHEGGFVINQKNYIQVLGFRIINSKSTINGGFGIVCYQSDHCIIKNNQTYNTYHSGIISRTSTNVVIDGNEIELANNNGSQEMLTISGGAFITVTNNNIHNGGSGNSGGEGINVKNGAHDVLVKGNHIHDNSSVGIYVDAYEGDNFNITIDGNVVNDNMRSGIAIEAEKSGYSASNVVVINNIVYGNGTSGIVLGDWGSGNLQNITIVNNTVAQNGIGTGHGGIGLWCDRAKNVIVRNNIVSQNGSYSIEVQGTPPAEATITHNLIDGYRNQPNETLGTNYITGDPRFVNASVSDFRLLPDSPAINAGTSANAPDHDFVDYQRPNASKWDIGAYEYGSSVVTPITIFSDNFNSSFSGWSKTGSATWNTTAPRIGSHSIRLAGNASISRGISTLGYTDIRLVMYLGAKSYEAQEQLRLSWWDGGAWQILDSIKNGTTRENGKLNKLQFSLPAAAANNPNFKIRVQQLSSDTTDYGYIDQFELIATPQ